MNFLEFYIINKIIKKKNTQKIHVRDYLNINKKNMVTNKGYFIKSTYKPISKRGSYPDLPALVSFTFTQ